jgi:LacI family transcriptional regulator
MKEKKSSKATLGDVAKAAGISKTSAGCALKNLPGVSESTRRRVLQIASRLDYSPDPRLAARMIGIRQATTRDLLPIAWLNTNKRKDAWQKYLFLSPLQEGAQQRCKELGYRIEEIWTRQPGLTMRRISQIIDQQGIEGVIITEPARHFQLNWDRLAGVAIGGGLLAPALHRVAADVNFNLGLALKTVKRLGYRRIGVCLTEEMDRFSRHDARAITLYFNSEIPPARRIPPLFFPDDIQPDGDIAMFAAWLKRERPDVVLGCHCNMVNWVKEAGYRVPEEVGVVHLGVENDVLNWAGIFGNKREIGRMAADMLISQIQHRAYGVPQISSTRLVRGFWQHGCTLLAPKPRGHR